MTRIVAPALAAVVLLAALAAVVVWWGPAAGVAGRLEHEAVSDFSRMRVRRDGDVRLLTFVRDDGAEVVQSRVDLSSPHTLLSPYARGMFVSYLHLPHPRRALVVGLGGGAMVRFLTHHEPQLRVDVVEIDPVVVRLAAEYFGVRSGGHVRVLTADAVSFVASTADRYDMVFMDAFLRPSGDTDATGVPSGLKTAAFLRQLRQRLSPGGVVAFNVNAHAGMADDIAAVAEAFGVVAVYRCPPADNRVVLASETGRLAAADGLRTGVSALDRRFGGALSFATLLANQER